MVKKQACRPAVASLAVFMVLVSPCFDMSSTLNSAHASYGVIEGGEKFCERAQVYTSCRFGSPPKAAGGSLPCKKFGGEFEVKVGG